jgi:hypothetical protein
MEIPDYRMISFSHIAGLKYAMAGDMESVELLAQLEERRHAIQWDDPAFVQMSEEMRAPLPSMTPQQEAEQQTSLLALLHVQTQRLAANDETASSLVPTLKKILIKTEGIKKQSNELIALNSKCVNLLDKILDLHALMKDKLQMLGVDTAEYEIPDELWP